LNKQYGGILYDYKLRGEVLKIDRNIDGLTGKAGISYRGAV
jgi:hypothetical protein